MDTFNDNIEDLVAHVSGYVETQKEILLISVHEKASASIAQTIIWTIFGSLMVVASVFLSVALAFWLGGRLQNNALGFLLTGLLYAFTGGIFLVFFKDRVQYILSTFLLTKFTRQHEQQN